jgi:hypothetical protein
LKSHTNKKEKIVKTRFLAAATLVAALAMPALAQAQGIVGGAEQGYDRGNRAAGPVGGVVGGAVGAGVGGAVGGVKGVLGIPDRRASNRNFRQTRKARHHRRHR